jgi:hypothetical protein
LKPKKEKIASERYSAVDFDLWKKVIQKAMSDGGENGGLLLNRRVEPFNHLRRDGDGAALEYLDGGKL